MDTAEVDVTALLASAQAGDKEAADRVYPIVCRELRRIAAQHLKKESPADGMQPTALINEAYLRLAQHQRAWADREHFFAFASRVMRHVLVDEARRRESVKRGSGAVPVALDAVQVPAADRFGEILLIDQLLTQLSHLHERQAQVVEMQFFGGLSEDEIARALGVSVRTVRRDWITAKAWLHEKLTP